MWPRRALQIEPGDVEGRDYVLCRLCMTPFRAIMAEHLVRIHGWDSDHPVLEYARKYGPKSHISGITRGKRRMAQQEFFERTGRRWTRRRVIEEIRRRDARKQPIHYQAVRRARPVLAFMGVHHFGSWDKALGRAGFDSSKIRLWRVWNPERVILAIRRRRREGRRLNVGAVFLEEPSLLRRAQRDFGSWEQALRSAGIDLATVERGYRVVWTRPKVIELLKAAAPNPRSESLAKEHPGAVTAAFRYFGTWRAAVEAAGLQYVKALGRQKFWTAERILEEIRTRKAHGRSLQATQVKSEGSLYDVALREFGDWRRAVKKAGCAEALPGQAWTRREIVAALKDLAARHGKITLTLLGTLRRSNRGSIGPAIRRHFGTPSRALSAAGLDWHRSLPWKIWSKERIVEEIRKLHQQGKPVNHAAVPSALSQAGMKRCGSWNSALKAAGLDPARIRKRRDWTPQRVVEAILKAHMRGQDLSLSAVLLRDSGLAAAAENRWGCWRKALMAAGLDPDAHRRSRIWTNEEVLKSIRELARGTALAPGALRKADPRLYGAAERRWGSAAKAIAEALTPTATVEPPSQGAGQQVRNEATPVNSSPNRTAAQEA